MGCLCGFIDEIARRLDTTCTCSSPGPDLQKKAHTRSVSYGENYSEGYPITHKKGLFMSNDFLVNCLEIILEITL